ncbi:sugar phosphate isomerase/epimerase [Limosilactobacillus sp. STM2_1]|uniref:Sugar phosphate isomerase/epimerase n=1 Tax=Limosilactobacillus rudii TaxID=2759755 RepID=A0A7W3UM77_9LACO|nr:TIM barrel protein [Limosilactobacillus rudii]MBB1079384.1 sugar phosphate isomerase/epimerase [Limosilactobacillus rudii]MBB1097430.1 sugar phosphate isomerase/epimerase [Limosilactobacillus rudii]MCD7134539.1 sugar phosphate isomerase/epimerase [Limosilactobacillus rudii]
MFQPQLGLKGSSHQDQLDDRLIHHPYTYEFFTANTDFSEDGYQRLYDAIQYVQSTGVTHIVLHHPMKYHEYHSEVVAPEQAYPELYRFIEVTTEKLLRLASDLDAQVLIHGGYSGPKVQHMVSLYPSVTAAREFVYRRLDRFAADGGNHIMFENSIAPVFAYGDPIQREEILSHNYRLAFDTSHCFIDLHGDNSGLQSALKQLRNNVVHYHLVDSMGQTHDSLTLGTGKIDWDRVLPLLNEKATSIYEINLKDQTNCYEQLVSHDYLTKVYQKLNN